MSVSSIGLDRPLKKDRDFARNLDKKVTAKLYAPLEKKKEYTGVLRAFDAGSFTLEAFGWPAAIHFPQGCGPGKALYRILTLTFD